MPVIRPCKAFPSSCPTAPSSLSRQMKSSHEAAQSCKTPRHLRGCAFVPIRPEICGQEIDEKVELLSIKIVSDCKFPLHFFLSQHLPISMRSCSRLLRLSALPWGFMVPPQSVRLCGPLFHVRRQNKPVKRHTPRRPDGRNQTAFCPPQTSSQVAEKLRTKTLLSIQNHRFSTLYVDSFSSRSTLSTISTPCMAEWSIFPTSYFQPPNRPLEKTSWSSRYP